jgi:hypothetical protein
MSRRWLWQIVWSMMAAVVSLYVAYLVMQYYGLSSTAYEPKDFERQDLYEQTGKSAIDRADRR